MEEKVEGGIMNDGGRSDTDALHEWFEAVGGGAATGSRANGLEQPLVQQNPGEARGGGRGDPALGGEAVVAKDGMREDVIEGPDRPF